MISVEARVEGTDIARVVAAITSKVIEKKALREGPRIGEVDSFGVRATSQEISVVVNPPSLAGDEAFADYIRALTREAIEEAINS